MKAVGNSIVQKLSETPPHIEDLPISSGTPLKITLTGDMTASVSLYVSGEFFWTVAKTDAIAATRLSGDTTRGKYPAGNYVFECSGNHTDNLYLLSTGSAITDGVSVAVSEFA